MKVFIDRGVVTAHAESESDAQKLLSFMFKQEKVSVEGKEPKKRKKKYAKGDFTLETFPDTKRVEIVKLLNDGVKTREVARVMGLNIHQVYHILKHEGISLATIRKAQKVQAIII